MSCPVSLRPMFAVHLALLAACCLAACGTTSAHSSYLGADITDTSIQIKVGDTTGDVAKDVAKTDVAADVAVPSDAAADAKTQADAIALDASDAKADIAIDVAAADVAKQDSATADAKADATLIDIVADIAPDAAAVDVGLIEVGSVDAASTDSAALDAASTDSAALDAAVADALPSNTVCPAGQVWLGSGCATSTAGLNAGGAEFIAPGAVSLYLVPPGSILVNGGAEGGGFDGWATTDGGDPWKIVNGDAPFGGRYFRGSYAMGNLAQTIDLVTGGVSAASLDAGTALHFGFFGVGWGYTSSTGKSDIVKLDLAYQDATGASIGVWSSGEITLPIGTWSAISLDTTNYPVGTRKVGFTISSIDGEYWAGNYAAKVDGAYLSAGGLEMRISNGDGVWSTWQPFAPTVAGWSLAPGSGAKTVQVEFRDAKGVSLGIVSDTVSVQ